MAPGGQAGTSLQDRELSWLPDRHLGPGAGGAGAERRRRSSARGCAIARAGHRARLRARRRYRLELEDGESVEARSRRHRHRRALPQARPARTTRASRAAASITRRPRWRPSSARGEEVVGRRRRQLGRPGGDVPVAQAEHVHVLVRGEGLAATMSRLPGAADRVLAADHACIRARRSPGSRATDRCAR